MHKSQDIVVRKLGKTFAAEVIGFDLSSEPAAASAKRVWELIEQYYVVCIRNQHFTHEEFIRFSQQMGPLEDYIDEEKTKGTAAIYNVGNTGPDGSTLPPDDPRVRAQATNVVWHTDSSYRDIPASLSLLFGREVLPPEAPGGETEFSDMMAAYEGLPEAMQKKLAPLHMVHSIVNARRLFDLAPVTPAQLDAVPSSCHPVIRVHPDRGGRCSLFFSGNVAREVGGVPLKEGQKLHDVLMEHANHPDYTYRHRWQVGDLLIWDNRVTMHRAVPYELTKYRRMLERTTVAGTGPVLGPFSSTVA